METKEQKKDDNKTQQQWPNFSCCQPLSGSHRLPDCCKDMGNSDNYRSKMAECMKGCRWFPIIPIIIGISLLLLGFYLDPEITRILWMIAASLIVIMGGIGLLMISRMKKFCC